MFKKVTPFVIYLYTREIKSELKNDFILRLKPINHMDSFMNYAGFSVK